MSEALRAHKRHDARIPVQIRCEDWGEFVKLHAENISAGGLFVGSDAELAPVGAVVEIEIALPEGHGELTLDAEVVHVIDAPEESGQSRGMGLKIMAMTPAQEGHLEALVHIARMSAGTTEEVIEPLEAKSSLDEASLFDNMREGRTGRISISAELMLTAAEKLIGDKRYSAAKREIQQVLAEDPQHVKARVWLLTIDARIFVGESKTDEATEKYRQIVAIDDQNEEAVAFLRSQQGTGLFRKIFSK